MALGEWVEPSAVDVTCLEFGGRGRTSVRREAQPHMWLKHIVSRPHCICCGTTMHAGCVRGDVCSFAEGRTQQVVLVGSVVTSGTEQQVMLGGTVISGEALAGSTE